MAQSQPLISEDIKSALSSLLTETAKTPKPLTVQELITQNRQTLSKMLKNGHSHGDIAVVFRAHNLTVNVDTVKTLLTAGNKKKATKDKAPALPAEATLTISHEQADAITAEWQRLAEIRRGFTKQELVAAMTAEIEAALESGYTFADIAELLKKKGVTIAPSSLQKYHRKAKRGDEPEPITATEDATQPVTKPPTSSLPQLTNADALFDEEFANE